MTRQRGFTLAEAIIAIVVMGVLAGVLAIVIRAPVKSYTDSKARAELADGADLALRRMARELRAALPNSIRVIGDGHAIEFLPVKAGGRYLSSEDGDADGVSRFALDFTGSASNKKFTVVGPTSTFATQVAAGNSVVVYNLGSDFAPADAWSGGNRASIHAITSAGGITTIELDSNPFVAQLPIPLPSPNQRFQVVSTPVTYYCGTENGALTLRRYWGYPISASPSDPPPASASSALLATGLASCAGMFSYDGALVGTGSPAQRRSGLVIITLSLLLSSTPSSTITLVDQVHVDNTP